MLFGYCKVEKYQCYLDKIKKKVENPSHGLCVSQCHKDNVTGEQNTEFDVESPDISCLYEKSVVVSINFSVMLYVSVAVRF